MPETRQFTCVVCPRGCALVVDLGPPVAGGPGQILAVRGKGCARGEVWARGEILDPRRSLTSTLRLVGLSRRRLPVRSSGEVPLGRLVEAARALDPVTIDHPVACGDILVKNLLGLGVDIVATDDIDH